MLFMLYQDTVSRPDYFVVKFRWKYICHVIPRDFYNCLRSYFTMFFFHLKTLCGIHVELMSQHPVSNSHLKLINTMWEDYDHITNSIDRLLLHTQYIVRQQEQ